ncbi:MAG: beta-1,6-N-acetylglucosaminyltransferase [Parachlamydiaceae bacterium]
MCFKSIAIYLSLLLISFQSLCLGKEKIALLFLTRSDLNHPNLWKLLLEESSDKYNVYFHSKDPLLDPFFKSCRISKIVPTTWSIHARAWQALIQEAIQNSENAYFAFLSESCIPLYTLDYIYSVITADPRTHMAFATKPWWPSSHPRELHTIDPKYRCGNAEWIVMNRMHAEIVATDRAIIRIVSRHENDQESYFSTLFKIHDCLFENLCGHSYTYFNMKYATNNGASPYHFSEVNEFSESLIQEAYSIGSLFARKFTPSYPESRLMDMIREHTP